MLHDKGSEHTVQHQVDQNEAILKKDSSGKKLMDCDKFDNNYNKIGSNTYLTRENNKNKSLVSNVKSKLTVFLSISLSSHNLGSSNICLSSLS